MKEYTLKIKAIDFNTNLELEIETTLSSYSLDDAKSQTRESLKSFYNIISIETK